MTDYSEDCTPLADQDEAYFERLIPQLNTRRYVALAVALANDAAGEETDSEADAEQGVA